MRKNLSEMIRKSAATLNAEQNVQVEQLVTEVAELRVSASPDRKSDTEQQLEYKVEELTLALAKSGGEREIPVNLLDLDESQPRTIIPQQLIQKRAESLQRNGQIAPIIVLPQSNGRYLVFEGALRTLAAPLAGMTTLRAVFLSNNDSTIFEKQFTTSDDSEKLHDLDFASGLIKIICDRYPYLREKQEEIPLILNRAINHLKATGKAKEIGQIQITDEQTQQNWLDSVAFKEPEQKDIVATILHRQLNPCSISSNIFPILKLSKDLKTVIKQTGLEGSKAKVIAKLTSEALRIDEPDASQLRCEMAWKVIKEELSLTQTRALVNELLKKHNSSRSTEDRDLEKLKKQIQSIKFTEIPCDRLKEVEKLLKDKLKELRQLQ